MSTLWLLLAALAMPDVQASCAAEHGGLRLHLPHLALEATTGGTLVLRPMPHLRPAELAMPGEPSTTLEATGPQAPGFIGPEGKIFALADDKPGLYRAAASAPGAATLLVAGAPLALCGRVDGEGWAAVWLDDDLAVVAVSTRTPAITSLSLDEAVALALAGTDPQVVVELLRGVQADPTARTDGTLELLAWPAASRPQPEVRVAAAQAWQQSSAARAIWALWLLGHDAAVAVRRAALEATLGRCQREPVSVCMAMLEPLVQDPEPEVGWGARDALLRHDARAALRGAPVAYKLDLLAALVERLERAPRPTDWQALELLAVDPAFEVQQAASLALGQLTP